MLLKHCDDKGQVSRSVCFFFFYTYGCLTQPHVNVVRGCGGGEEQQVGISSVEVAVQGLGNRLQVQVLDAPHLQARLLSRIHKLFMGNHDGSVDDKEQQNDLDIINIHVGRLLRMCSRSQLGPQGSLSKQMQGRANFKWENSNSYFAYLRVS